MITYALIAVTQIALIACKLLGVIALPWWLVLAPVGAPLIAVGGLVLIVLWDDWHNGNLFQ